MVVRVLVFHDAEIKENQNFSLYVVNVSNNLFFLLVLACSYNGSWPRPS